MTIHSCSSSNELYLTPLSLDYSGTFQRKDLFSTQTKIQTQTNFLSDSMISAVY